MLCIEIGLWVPPGSINYDMFFVVRHRRSIDAKRGTKVGMSRNLISIENSF